MKKSIVVISNNFKTFGNNTELIQKLYHNLSVDKIKKFDSYLLEHEYSGKLWHTYNEITHSKGELKQFFVYDDNSDFFKSLCSSEEFCDMIEEIKKNNWVVNIIEDQ